MNGAPVPAAAPAASSPSGVSLGEAARWYVRQGIPVFPLVPRTKEPFAKKHGFLDASTDPAQIEEWWTAHPDANVGMPTGAASGRLLLDCDFRGACKARSRDDVRELYGEWGDTAEVITGAGLHVYFSAPPGKVPKEIDAGIELKGNGGYAVLPPSIHPNGGVYQFDGLNGRESFLKLAPPPEWLLQSIADAQAKHSAAAGAGAIAGTEKFPEGGRNNGLTSLAGTMRRAGFSPEGIAAALLLENQRRCEPPLPEDEVRKIAASVGRYQPAPAPLHPAVQIHGDSLAPSVDSLNSLAVFGGHVRFESVKRRGPMILAKFGNGAEGIWRTATDLTTFARSQSIIFDATGILIPTPSDRRIRPTWEPIAQLIRRVADRDAVEAGPGLAEEFSQIIRSAWERADRPTANTEAEFNQILRECQTHRRDPQADTPRCCVWIGPGSTWVHQTTLTDWLSTPGAKHKHYQFEEVRAALYMLDFRPRNLNRSLNGIGIHVRVWEGPLDVLTDDETDE